MELASPLKIDAKPLRILILGYGPMGMGLARGALRCEPGEVELVGVFPWSYKPKAEHFGRERTEQEFLKYLADEKIPLVRARSVNHYSFVELLTQLQPHMVLVATWGEIFKPFILNLPDILFVNCHPSLLPLHKGANPFSAVIRQGETHTGVTFHLMDKGIDTGPILLQESLLLAPDETGETLRDRCAQLTEEMVPRLVSHLLDGNLVPRIQTEQGSYEGRLQPDDGWIEWDLPPKEIERNIRGLYPWYDSITLFQGQMVGFRFGSLRPNTAPEQPPFTPGTILEVEPNTVVTATSDPAMNLVLDDPRFMEMPKVLNPVLCKMNLRRGKQFYTPTLPSPSDPLPPQTTEV